jgi:uncharacterized low-complexity protein
LAEQADAANQARPRAAACNNSRQVSVPCSELQQAFQQNPFIHLIKEASPMTQKTISIKPVAAAVGVAFVTSLIISSAALAADNPFTMIDLDSGYLLAGDEKGEEGKCGEGKCGEGKCGGEAKGAHGHAKGEEGKCGEGKCGEGKCGSDAQGAHMHDEGDEG